MTTNAGIDIRELTYSMCIWQDIISMLFCDTITSPLLPEAGNTLVPRRLCSYHISEASEKQGHREGHQSNLPSLQTMSCWHLSSLQESSGKEWTVSWLNASVGQIQNAGFSGVRNYELASVLQTDKESPTEQEKNNYNLHFQELRSILTCLFQCVAKTI